MHSSSKQEAIDLTDDDDVKFLPLRSFSSSSSSSSSGSGSNAVEFDNVEEEDGQPGDDEEVDLGVLAFKIVGIRYYTGVVRHVISCSSCVYPWGILLFTVCVPCLFVVLSFRCKPVRVLVWCVSLTIHMITMPFV